MSYGDKKMTRNGMLKLFDEEMTISDNGEILGRTKVVDVILQELESRTCLNCIHYNEDEDSCYSDVVNKYSEIQFHENNKLFGCNVGFERGVYA